MTITTHIRWDEGPLSIGGGKGNATMRYVAVSDDPANDGRDEVLSQLINDAPETLFGLIRDTFDIHERLSDTPTEAHWDCEVRYILASRKQPFPLFYRPPDPRPFRMSIRSASAGTANMLYSREFKHENAVDDYVMPGELVQYIGFEANPKDATSTHFGIKGVSVPLGAVEVVVDTVALYSEVNAGFLVDVALLAGSNAINNASWLGWPEASLRFTSFQADQRERGDDEQDPSENEEQWELKYVFLYQPPVVLDDLPPGLPGWAPPLPNNTKRGHDYLDSLWVEEPVDFAAGVKFTTPKLKRLAIQRIFPEANFGILGIGG